MCYNQNMKSIATQNGIYELLNSKIAVEVFDNIDSTNLYAKECVKSGRKEEFLVVAREQSCGRGRFERKFYSPKDCGVYFSLVIEPTCTEELGLLTPMCGVAVVNGIKKTLDKDTKIKWVNDIFYDDKKCTGILCEAIASGGMISRVVLGIGINLYEKDGGADEEIKDIISFVGDRSADLANRLIASIVNEIYALHNGFDKNAIVSEYKRHSFLIGKDIEVCVLDEETRLARVLDIDENCNLVVRYQEGRVERLNSADTRIVPTA